MEPCGTPHLTRHSSDTVPSTFTLWTLPYRYEVCVCWFISSHLNGYFFVQLFYIIFGYSDGCFISCKLANNILACFVCTCIRIPNTICILFWILASKQISYLPWEQTLSNVFQVDEIINVYIASYHHEVDIFVSPYMVIIEEPEIGNWFAFCQSYLICLHW